MKNDRCPVYSMLGVLEGILINIEQDNLCVVSQMLSEPNTKKFFADEELILTAQTFFENNLNLMQTSKELIVHRNTLIYRLDKIKKLLNLDIRKFNDAVTLHVLLVVKKTEIKRKRHTNKLMQLQTLE